jgi:hypothetical protein
MPRKLLVATHNRGKLREYADLLSGLPFTLVASDELGLDLQVAESGATYVDNARLKALAYAQASGLLTLADDSGLEVDALDGLVCARRTMHGRRYRPGDRAAHWPAGIAEDNRSAPFAASSSRRMTAGLCTGGGARAISSLRDAWFSYDPVSLSPAINSLMNCHQEKPHRPSRPCSASDAAHPGEAGRRVRWWIKGTDQLCRRRRRTNQMSTTAEPKYGSIVGRMFDGEWCILPGGVHE